MRVAPADDSPCGEWGELRSLGLSILGGVRVAIIGASLVAILECAALFLVAARHSEAKAWLIPLLGPVLGKLAVTYALLFSPLLILCAIIRWGFVRRRAASPAEPLLAALLVAGVGSLFAQTAVQLAFQRMPLPTAAFWVATIALALGVYALLRTTLRKVGRARFGRSANVMSCLGLAVIVLSGVAFTRSPLFAPARFRVARAQQMTQDRQRPNVLWIVLDAARADRMSVYGYSRETTPFLKRWSSRAILFERCISNGMWTVPSHTSMFTGMSLRQHGTDHQHAWLDESFVTVAEVLRRAGYNTALFSNNPWISHAMNLDQGFDVSRTITRLRSLTRFSSLEDLCLRWGLTPLLPWWDHDYGGAITNWLISDWLDDRGNQGEPFFLFVNYMEAHLPYLIPRKYRRMFMTNEQVARSYELRFRAFGLMNGFLDMRFNLRGGEFLVQADREVLKRQYEAGLRYLDDRVSELIRMLEERGHLENTLVVITSDHGEYLDTHGMWAHRFLTYNDLVHVPLILQVPGRDQPARVATPVQLSDLYATVLKAALGRHEPGPGLDSRDLLELADCPAQPRVVISECGGPREATRRRALRQDNPIATHRIQPQIAAQDGRFKYIASADGERELYDLIADPGELCNVIDAKPAEAERLSAFIEGWHESTPRYRPPEDEAIREMTPDVIEALRSLGYLGN